MSSIPFENNLAVVNLDVSIWAARAKVRPEDLPSDVLASLPPAELATLGSKRLFPLDAMRPFNAIKMRAYSFLCSHGVRFLSGFAIDRSTAGVVDSALAAIRTDFDNAVQTFLTAYDEGVQNWQASFPQWASVLAAATPTVSDVSRRFSFRYQIFEVSGVASADNLRADMSALPGHALEDVAADVRRLLADTYTDGRHELKGKSLNPLRALCDKVDALSFLSSDFSSLGGILRAAVSAVETDSAGPSVPALRALLVSLSDASAIRRIAENITDGTQTAADVWDTQLDEICRPVPPAASLIPPVPTVSAPIPPVPTAISPLSTVPPVASSVPPARPSATMLIDSLLAEL